LDKCRLEPAQTVKFLGWELDLRRRELRMTAKRRAGILQKLFQLGRMASRREFMRTRDLASLIGILNFLRAQFPLASLHMVKLNQLKNSAVKKSGWQGTTTITPMVLGETKWWIKTVTHNTPHDWRPLATDVALTTDASPWGWGATLDRPNTETTFMWGLWTKSQRTMTSNHKELEAIRLALKDATPWLISGSDIVVRSDNTAAVFAVQKWRAKQHRLRSLKKMARWMTTAQMRVTARYLPGAQNGAADSLSRMGKSFEFYMTTTTWKTVQELTRPMTLDVFASRTTARLPRYCTLDKNDGHAVAVDGLSVSWREEVVLLHPPPTLILQTIQKAIEERVTGVLIVPDWKGQIWSPLVAQLSETQTNLGSYQTTMRRTDAMIEKGWLLPPGTILAHVMGMRMMTGRSSSTSSPDKAVCR
jgi:ribonuclease HI